MEGEKQKSNMLEPGNQVQQRLGLTPAKAPPKNFKNADKLEFFEVCAQFSKYMPTPHNVMLFRQEMVRSCSG